MDFFGEDMEGKKVSKIQLIKSGFWYTISDFMTRATVFITMPIFTRLLSNEEYGNFTVFANWQGLLVMICGLEVNSTLNRARFDFTEKEEFNGYITSALLSSTIFTAVVFAFYLMFPGFFERMLLLDRRYMLAMFAYLFTYPAFSTFQAKQRITYHYKLSAAIAIVLSVSSSLMALFLAYVMKEDRLLGRIVGQYGLTIAAGILFYVYFVSRSRAVTARAIKYALRLGIPFIFSYTGSQIMLSSDILVVKHMCTAKEVSYISVTGTTSNIILLLIYALNSAWGPWFYDMLKNERRKEIRKVYQIYLWGTVICTFAILLIGPEIILILGGTKYAESIYLLPPTILCGTFTVMTAQFGSLETYYKKPEYASILVSIVAVLNIFLNILGVKMWGYRAVCYTTVFSQLLLISLHYMATLRMGIRELLPLRQMLLVLGTVIMLIPAALLLYINRLARYICIIACIIPAFYFIVKNQKKILQALRSFRDASRR